MDSPDMHISNAGDFLNPDPVHIPFRMDGLAPKNVNIEAGKFFPVESNDICVHVFDVHAGITPLPSYCLEEEYSFCNFYKSCSIITFEAVRFSVAIYSFSI